MIGVVTGLAAAAGCQLVSSCDLVLATPTARFSTPGASVGLFCHTPGIPLARKEMNDDVNDDNDYNDDDNEDDDVQEGAQGRVWLHAPHWEHHHRPGGL